MKVGIGAKSLHVARYFEYGGFAGFFWGREHDTLKEYLQLDQLLSYSVMLKKMSRQIKKEMKNCMRKRASYLFFHSTVLVSIFPSY